MSIYEPDERKHHNRIIHILLKFDKITFFITVYFYRRGCYALKKFY